jgi:CDP-glycerol glycerophosphotransferase (TagB/SpsB family)
MSIRKHLPERNGSPMVRALKGPALALAALRAQQPLENWLERLLLKYPRSVEAEDRLRQIQPAAVVCTGPHRYEEPAIVAAAKRQGIPVLAMITSWDNLTTKNRMMFQYDGYIVWSPQMRRELHEFYPQTRGTLAYEIGAPQFDVFFQDEFRESREEFCARQGLRPDRPIILHALGSPNFIPGEYYAALHLAARVARGDLGDVQMLIRPHPLFETGEETKQMSGFGPRVILQRTGQAGTKLIARSQDRQQILDWVSTFRHCDVLVNLFSTVAIDAAIFDKPVVNLDYDPSPERKRHAMIKDVNHVWSHFKPLTESGAMWTVQNNDEMVEAVRGYLKDPTLHREKRRWMAEYVCGHLDGRCGERLARAILDFVGKREAGGKPARPAA